MAETFTEKGQIFFIADLHFGDEAIIRYEGRPFSSAEEMGQALMANWNRRVSESDTVFVLGDFSVYGWEKDAEILQNLRGHKFLIMGNHDMRREPKDWRALGFAECSPFPVIFREFYMLSHEPLYLNKNMPYANLYGHVHGNSSYRDVSGQSICLSAERIGYTPLSFAEITQRMRAEREAGPAEGRNEQITE